MQTALNVTIVAKTDKPHKCKGDWVYESAIYEHLEKKGFKVASNYKVGDNTVILIDLDEQDENPV